MKNDDILYAVDLENPDPSRLWDYDYIVMYERESQRQKNKTKRSKK